MEAGQCYTCTMIKDGKCDCTQSWQGVCPYTEYVQNGRKVRLEQPIKACRIINMEVYSPTLTVITLECQKESWLEFGKIGAFVMFRWKDFYVPVSVLCCGNLSDGKKGYVKFAINASGPKTIGLLEEATLGSTIYFKGPFFGGLVNAGSYDTKKLSIVVAKGIAIMPVINQLEDIGSNLYKFYLDRSKLPSDFIEDYLNDIDFEIVNLNDDFEKVAKSMADDFETCKKCTGMEPNMFFMASPFFAHRLRDSIDNKKIIMPNHSNMCCGQGICGSCSYTDENGITVRMCKCMD